MYPFGYGLSYSTFEYSKVKLSAKDIKMDGTITAECTVKNTGKYDAKEVVQLYVRDLVASLARPVRELKGFQKIELKVGESKTVKFEIKPSELGFWNLENNYVTEPGEFRVWISKDSQSGEPVSFNFRNHP
jgi:beta-glucosidase